MPSYEKDLFEFERRNAQVLGISTDSVHCLEAWAKTLGGLSYPLLSDGWPYGHASAQYDVLRGDTGQSERAIFIVDARGRVAYVDIHDITEQPPVAPILQALDRLV